MNTVKNGWKDNPGIVLMKSKDLVNWTHSKIVLKEDYKEHFSDAYWVWAPQTIYDKKAKKYMIYFTLQRTGDGRKSLVTYYAYANKDFPVSRVSQRCSSMPSMAASTMMSSSATAFITCSIRETSRMPKVRRYRTVFSRLLPRT